MSRLLTILCVVILIVSCQNKQATERIILPKIFSYIDTTVILEKFSIIDSLNKYRKADSLVKFKFHKIYATKINGEKIGLVETSDTTTLVFQNFFDKWTVTDTLDCALYIISPTDLNGDNFKDLRITYYITGSGGNSENVSLLYYPDSKKFKHNKFYDLPNFKYDKKKNLIFSAWYSGGNRPQDKMVYEISGDSLTFKEGVTFEPDEDYREQSATVEFYNELHGKRIVAKRIKGSSGKTYGIFNRSFWDSSRE